MSVSSDVLAKIINDKEVEAVELSLKATEHKEDYDRHLGLMIAVSKDIKDLKLALKILVPRGG